MYFWMCSGCQSSGFSTSSKPQCSSCRKRSTVKIVELTRKILRETRSPQTALFLDPFMFRVGTLDIEATGLTGDFHIVLCAVIKRFGINDKPVVFRIDIKKPDLMEAERKLLLEIKDYIEKNLDGVITYYGSRYDIPMLRTRMLAQGIDPLDKLRHLDMYFTIRRTLVLTSRRMANVNELIRRNDVKSTPEKTRIGTEFWQGAVYSRDKASMDYIVDHCVKDVLILEGITNAFRKFVPERVNRM